MKLICKELQIRMRMKEFYIEEFYVIGICVLLDEVGCDTSFQIVKRVSNTIYIYIYIYIYI